MIMVADIQRAVADHYGIDVATMSEPDGAGARDSSKTRPRQQAMYLSACLTKQPYTVIGRLFHRDHSTVIHAVQATTKRLATDKEAQEAMRLLAREILA